MTVLSLFPGKSLAVSTLSFFNLSWTFFFEINLFVYFRLHWVFVAAHDLSLVAASGGYALLR